MGECGKAFLLVLLAIPLAWILAQTVLTPGTDAYAPHNSTQGLVPKGDR